MKMYANITRILTVDLRPLTGATGRAVGLRPTGEQRPRPDAPERPSHGDSTAQTILPAGSDAPAEPREPFRLSKCIGPLHQERPGDPIRCAVSHKQAGLSKRKQEIDYRGLKRHAYRP